MRAGLALAIISGCGAEPRSPLASIPRGAAPVELTLSVNEADPVVDSIIERILAHYDQESRAKLRPLLEDRHAIVQLPDRPEMTTLLQDLMLARSRQQSIRGSARARDSVWVVMRDSLLPITARAIVLVGNGDQNGDTILVRPDVSAATFEAALHALERRRSRFTAGSNGTKRLLIVKDGTARRPNALMRRRTSAFLDRMRSQSITPLSDSALGRIAIFPRDP